MTTQEAKAFLDECIEKIGNGFHPDTPFLDYIDVKGNELFTEDQAEEMNEKMDSCFRVDGFDPYEYCIEKMN